MRRSGLGIWLALPLVVLASRTAAADDRTSGALAESLFREGRKLMDAGAFDQACPKLEESEHLDPRLGTLLNLAFCHAKQGRSATAWGEYARAAVDAQRAGRKENETAARERMADLEGRLSRVTLRVTASYPGLTIALDGVTLGTGVLGSPLPLDPGNHELVAEAPGRAPFHRSVTVPVGPAATTVTIPSLENASSASLEPASPSAVASSEIRHPSYVGPIVVSGVAVVAAGVGTYLGIEAFQKNSDAGNCGHTCSAKDLAVASDGYHDANASTAAFVVAGLAAAGAITWWIIDRPGRAVRLSVGARQLTLDAKF